MIPKILSEKLNWKDIELLNFTCYTVINKHLKMVVY